MTARQNRTPQQTTCSGPSPAFCLTVLLATAFMISAVPGLAFANGKPADKPILLVVASRDFDFPEYRQITDVLAAQRCAAVIASTETTQAVATNDSLIKPNVLLGEVNAADYSALILIGGVGSILFWDDSTALGLAHDFANAKGPAIGAIGLAPLVLAKAGLLKGRSAAVYNDPKAAKIMADNGARSSFRDVVVDGQFITANGADAASKFARAIAKRVTTGNW